LKKHSKGSEGVGCGVWGNGDKLKGGAFCQLPDMVFGAKKPYKWNWTLDKKIYILHSPFSIPLTTTILP